MTYNDKYLKPKPGDVVVVENSDWYALKSGEKLQICEQSLIAKEKPFIAVAPWKTIYPSYVGWLPSEGREYLSTSGGPFRAINGSQLKAIGITSNTFWKWSRWGPGAQNGMRFTRKVVVWALDHLEDNR